MSDNENLLRGLIAEFEAFAEPLAAALQQPGGLHEFLAWCGWNLSSLENADLSAVAGLVATLQQGLSDLQSIHSLEDMEGIAKALRDLGELLAQLTLVREAIVSVANVQLTSEQAEALAIDIVNSLAVTHLRRRLPRVSEVLFGLTLLEMENAQTLLDGSGAILRYPIHRPRLRLENLSALLTDPFKHLKAAYFPQGGLTDESAAVEFVTRLFGRLEAIVRILGGRAMAGLRDPLDSELDDASIASFARSFTFAFEPPATPLRPQAGVAASQIGATLLVIPGSGLSANGIPGPALEIVPFGAASLEAQLAAWRLALDFQGSPNPLVVTERAVHWSDPGGGRIGTRIGISRGDEGAPGIVVGSTSGTRLEIEKIGFSAEMEMSPSKQEFGVLFDLHRAALVIQAGDGDGFLRRVLPADGVRAEFDLAIGWSNQRGLFFRGAAGLDAELRLGLDLLGVIAIDTIQLSLRATEAPDPAAVIASAAFAVRLSVGPVVANARGIGLQAKLGFPRQGGNLGPAQLDLRFKPPDGIGLSIDATVVKGGGFIGLDFEKQQYSGVLQLAIQKTIDVKAIGILNARLPGGRPGFSLLLIITAEFPPIQLGMGFTLNGIGGLAGINRTAAVDVLRAGLRNGALDKMLFPRDPLANVPALLSTLGAVFPVAEGRYVFGPMVRIGWGSPAILTLDVAVLIELPDPVRIILLGRLKAALPDEKKPVAVIRMDALGVLDFGRKELSLDATIYDSKILTFTLSGDMALRLSWGANPGFLLSVGGFHPHFQPPASMPTLTRMALVLVDFEKDGVTARVRLDSYFAITSNTVQFGAHVQAYVKVLAVEVQGLLGFDALVHFPFAIDAQMVAAVTLSFNGALLMGAEVALNLTGPGPWHLVGEARFVFLGLPARAHIDFTSGSGSAAKAELPPPADVAGQLVAALKDARNWQPVLAEALPRVARLAPAAAGAGELLMHPLAGLAVRQRVAPLGVLLARYGNAPIAGGLSRFQLQLNLANAATAPLREAFAMGQYQVLSDSDKLARPSFEEADAGLQAQVSDFGFAADAVLVVPAAAFEDRLVDPASAPPTAPPMAAPRRRARALRLPKLPKVQAQAVQAYLDTRAAAELAPRTRSGKGRYAPVPPTTPI